MQITCKDEQQLFADAAADDEYTRAISKSTAQKDRLVDDAADGQTYELNLANARVYLRNKSAALLRDMASTMDVDDGDPATAEGYSAVNARYIELRGAAEDRWMEEAAMNRGVELVAIGAAEHTFVVDYAAHWRTHDDALLLANRDYTAALHQVEQDRQAQFAIAVQDALAASHTALKGDFNAYAAAHVSPWATYIAAQRGAELDHETALGAAERDRLLAENDAEYDLQHSLVYSGYDRDAANADTAIDRWFTELDAAADQQSAKGNALQAWSQSAGPQVHEYDAEGDDRTPRMARRFASCR